MADVGSQAGDFGIWSHGFYFFWLYLPLFTFIGLDPFGDALSLGSFGRNAFFRPGRV
jgi:hypothetical protein